MYLLYIYCMYSIKTFAACSYGAMGYGIFKGSLKEFKPLNFPFLYYQSQILPPDSWIWENLKNGKKSANIFFLLVENAIQNQWSTFPGMAKIYFKSLQNSTTHITIPQSALFCKICFIFTFFYIFFHISWIVQKHICQCGLANLKI